MTNWLSGGQTAVWGGALPNQLVFPISSCLVRRWLSAAPSSAAGGQAKRQVCREPLSAARLGGVVPARPCKPAEDIADLFSRAQAFGSRVGIVLP